jgi:hypothetical protein
VESLLEGGDAGLDLGDGHPVRGELRRGGSNADGELACQHQQHQVVFRQR